MGKNKTEDIKWHAFLFKEKMIKAFLREEYPKTETRRVITRRNSYFDGGSWPKKNFSWYPEGHDEYKWDEAFVDPGPSPAGNPGPYLQLPVEHYMSSGILGDRSVHRIYPRIQPGDMMWAKETHRRSDWSIPDGIEYKADNLLYYFTKECPIGARHLIRGEFHVKGNAPWRSPLFMPKCISRIHREIESVLIQRVKDISPSSALAEGIDYEKHYEGLGNPCDEIRMVEAFLTLWDSINEERGFGTEVNPWVFAYKLREKTLILE